MCSAYLSVDWTAAQAQSQELRRRSSNLVISDASRGRFQSAVCVGYTQGKKKMRNTSVGTQKGKEKEQERREKKKKKHLLACCVPLSIVYLLLALMLADGDAASLVQ